MYQYWPNPSNIIEVYQYVAVTYKQSLTEAHRQHRRKNLECNDNTTTRKTLVGVYKKNPTHVMIWKRIPVKMAQMTSYTLQIPIQFLPGRRVICTILIWV